MNVKVSILVPIYNVEKYLKQCLDSIINQSLKEIQVICLDDGSTDGCPAILAEYAKKNSCIKVVTKSNSGYGNTMNIGISYAIGEYIGIVESDDYVDPYMFETLYHAAKENNLDIAKSLFTSFDDNTGEKNIDYCDYVTKDKVICPLEDYSPFLLTPSIWSAIYKTQLIKSNDIQFTNTPGAAYQDTAFFFKTHCVAKRYMLISKPLIFYRVSQETSSSTKITGNKMFYVLGEWNEVFHYIKNRRLGDIATQMAFVLKYSGVSWLFLRLDNKFKYQYLKKIQQELINDHSKIDWEIFSLFTTRKKLIMYKIIKASPQLFLFLSKFDIFVRKIIAY